MEGQGTIMSKAMNSAKPGSGTPTTYYNMYTGHYGIRSKLFKYNNFFYRIFYSPSEGVACVTVYDICRLPVHSSLKDRIVFLARKYFNRIFQSELSDRLLIAKHEGAIKAHHIYDPEKNCVSRGNAVTIDKLVETAHIRAFDVIDNLNTASMVERERAALFLEVVSDDTLADGSLLLRASRDREGLKPKEQEATLSQTLQGAYQTNSDMAVSK